MIKRSQDEITEKWPLNWEDNNPQISIRCLTYNHKEYIADALDGFLMQETSVPFEIIVHDDASTDGTDRIIREYEQKYPKIIKALYEEENLYSKKDGALVRRVDSAITGKYIALCEGDDCWIDPKKLEKQYFYMENHPKCTLCFTNGLLKVNGVLEGRVVPASKQSAPFYKPGDNDYSFEEMIYLDFVPTASLFYSKDVFERKPVVPKGAFGGDTLYRLYTTYLGYAHCIDEDTCIYNRGVSGSVTTQWNYDENKKNAFRVGLINLYKFLDEWTSYEYHSAFEKMITWHEYLIKSSTYDIKGLSIRKYRKMAWLNGYKGVVEYYLIMICPSLIKRYREHKRIKEQEHNK